MDNSVLKIITAKEANERTRTEIHNRVTNEIYDVMEKIYEIIKKGKFSFSHGGTLCKETVNRLCELGYKVECNTQYNEPYYVVSWENK